MQNLKTKNILICVTGLTPQIVTETLYCLAVQKKVKIDELFIITTARGRDVIVGNDKVYNKEKKYPPLKSELKKLVERYKIKNPEFNEIKNIVVAQEQTTELYDIRSDKQNLLFPNKVCEIIRDKTSNSENTLHCSISGGRKTMSVDLAFALTLFGGVNDKLYHILVNESMEFKKDFWFPRNKKEQEYLEMAELSYVKLRTLLGDYTRNEMFYNYSYTDLVELTQNQLRIKTAEKIFISRKRFISKRKRGEIWYGENKPISFPPSYIKLYEYFYSIKKSGQRSDNIKIVAHHIYNTMDPQGIQNIRSTITHINQAITDAIVDDKIAEIFHIDGLDEQLQYGIQADIDKIVFID